MSETTQQEKWQHRLESDNVFVSRDGGADWGAWKGGNTNAGRIAVQIGGVQYLLKKSHGTS